MNVQSLLILHRPEVKIKLVRYRYGTCLLFFEDPDPKTDKS